MLVTVHIVQLKTIENWNKNSNIPTWAPTNLRICVYIRSLVYDLSGGSRSMLLKRETQAKKA